MSDSTQDVKVAHERALNRERARRFRERRRNARNGLVTDDNGNPNSSLTRIARNLSAGMNDNQALLQAGSSRKATGLIDKARAGLTEVLRAQGLTVAKIAESTKESIEATSPMLTANGCIEKPDWAARATGRRDAIQLLDRAGELPATQTLPSGSQITVNIIRFGDTHTSHTDDANALMNGPVIDAQSLARTDDDAG